MSGITVPEPYHLVLASISKFRRQVLENLHIPFTSAFAGINEKEIRDPDPKELTKKLATAKMIAAIERNNFSDAIYVTADQVAVKDGKIREKPVNETECYNFLESYSNSYVEFYSAICVHNSNNGKQFVAVDVSRVDFSDISKEVQDHLMRIGDVMYTCGGVTVENPELQKCITSISCMDSIMGLPMKLLQQGIDYVLE